MIYSLKEQPIIIYCPVCNKYWDYTNQEECPDTGVIGSCCHEGLVEISSEALDKFLSGNIDVYIPVISSVTPNDGDQGSVIDATITGINLQYITDIQFGDGVIVNNFTINSDTQIVANITISDSATLGTRYISVSTGTETATLEDGFKVSGKAPTISLVNPSFGVKNATVELTITGTSLIWTTEIKVDDAITSGFSVISDTKVIATVKLGDLIGDKSVTVISPEGTATVDNKFSIIQSTPAPNPGIVSFGSGAYDGSNPIGGGIGYKSPAGYSESLAKFTVENLSDLNKAFAEAKTGELIWIPDGVTIIIPTVYSTSNRRLLKDNLKGILASNRGAGPKGGGKIKVTARSNGYMTGIWQSSYSVVSGLTVEGPGSFESTSPIYGYAGNCAFRSAGTKKIEFENCNIYNFACGILKFSAGDLAWNSPDRHIVHHCEIHGAQRHGFGYGIAQAEANGSECSVLVEACKIYDCRHLITCDHGAPYNFELRYNIFGDSWYKLSGTGTKTYATQIDAHGSGYSTSGYAGNHYEIHHNTFYSNNGKANIGIRGIPKDKFNIYNNWTKKTTRKGIYPSDGKYEIANVGGSLVDMEGSEGGYVSYDNNMPSHNVYAWNNWYGADAPTE